MIIVIYGEDSYRVSDRLKTMRSAFEQKYDASGMNVAEFSEGKKTESAAVSQEVRSMPFMAEKRMVIVHDIIGNINKPDVDSWLDVINAADDNVILVFVDTGTVKRTEQRALFKVLKKMDQVHMYAHGRMSEYELVAWMGSRAGARGVKLERAGAQALVERVGDDTWRLHHELEKVFGFVGEGGEVTQSVVESLVLPSFEGQIFALMDAISNRQPAQAIKRIKQERWAGSNDHYLLTMLARQVRILLSVRALLDERGYVQKKEVAHELGIHPFVAGKALNQAQRYSLDELKAAHEALFEYDQRIKTGQVDVETAVDLFVVDLLA